MRGVDAPVRQQAARDKAGRVSALAWPKYQEGIFEPD